MSGFGRLRALVCVVAGFVGAVSVVASPALATTPTQLTWHRQTAAMPAGHETNPELLATSCASATYCLTVGDNYDGSRRLAEIWNGSKWAIDVTPAPAGASETGFAGVDCVSATFCMIVGDTDQVALAERWDGHAWTVQSPPSHTKNAALDGVTCLSSTWCLAVGFDGGKVLADVWNGTQWTITAAQSPVSGDFLNGVTCTSTTNCIAVGSTGGGNLSSASLLIERWNGTTWHVEANNKAGDSSASLQGVACLSATNCYAVGLHSPAEYTPVRLVEHWNGSTWKPVTALGPQPPSGWSIFEAISCAGGQCVAAGASDYERMPFVDRVATGAWTVQTTPTLANGGGFFGVSCVSATACVASGFANGGSTITQPLIERSS
jgi:hypothetical protein